MNSNPFSTEDKNILKSSLYDDFTEASFSIFFWKLATLCKQFWREWND